MSNVMNPAIISYLLSFVSIVVSFVPPYNNFATFLTSSISLSKRYSKKCLVDMSDGELKGKKVLVRCDINVPLDGQKIADDTRIRSSIPTIDFLTSKSSIIAVCSHLGRPKGGFDPKYSLGPCAVRMSSLLGRDVTFVSDCLGDEVQKVLNNAEEGDVIMLENTRFYPQETMNDPVFAQKLAQPFDLFVNDAFGVSHRAHASTEGVTKVLKPSVAGLLLSKELEYLDRGLTNGKRPLAAIIGGSKVSSKINVINALLNKCDKIIIGGGMVFTFLRAKGLNVGTSLVEPDFFDTALKLLDKAKRLGKQIMLPSDIVVADKFSSNANTQIVPADDIPDGWMGLDNGPKTTKEQRKALSECKTIIMNGPMGVFEFDKFSTGTYAIVNILADLTKEKGVITIVGGGDSVCACEKTGRIDNISHISTGGGAALEFLEGKVLPGVASLTDK